MNRVVVNSILVAVLGYLIGGFNPSYLVAKIKGFDIRKSGSGNAGGSNALITMGKLVGIICMIIDILKAFLLVEGISYFFPNDTYLAFLGGTCCILGHIFPVYLKFKGGKGLACLGGVILAYSPLLFLILLVSEGILAFIVDYICIVPITASVIFPVVYGFMEKDMVNVVIISISSLAILYRHIENIKRISAGTEVHLSFLWKKDKEIERLKELTGKDQEDLDKGIRIKLD